MYSDLTAGQYALVDLARFVLMAVVVPAGAWIRGRRLGRMAPDDEATAEQHWAWYLARAKLVRIALVIWVASAFVWRVGAWMPGPEAPAFVSILVVNYLAMIFGLSILDYRVQKALKGLTCGLGRFLRLRAAFLLFHGWYTFLFLILFAMPFLYEYSRAPQWYAQFAALAAGLAAMIALYPRVSLRVVGAVREPPPELCETVERVAAQEGLAAPRIGIFSDRGTKSPSAFAIPVWSGRPAILISDYLLAALSPEEAGSVALHELGHCVKRQMRARLLVMWATMAGLLIAIPTATTLWPEAGIFFVFAFYVCLPVLVQAMRFQRYETQSDLFAARNAGADVTISALTKLHALSLLPRRFKAETEQRLSHPALARRIAAIQREFAPSTPPPAPVTELPPISAEDLRRRPVTFAVQEGRLVIRPAAPSGAESVPELVIPPDRILAAEIQRKGKAFRLRLRWADAEEELVYRVGEPEVEAARKFIASIDRHFLPADTPCQFSMARAATAIFRRSAIFGGLLALCGGLPLLITALVNRRRRNIEIFAGYIIASVGAAASVFAWESVLPGRWFHIGAALVCLWPGFNSAEGLQRCSTSVQLTGKQPGRRLRKPWVIVGLVVGVPIAAVVVFIGISLVVMMSSLLLENRPFLSSIIGCLLWVVAAIAASGPWWPRPSVTRALLILCCIVTALGLAGAAYLAPAAHNDIHHVMRRGTP